MTERKLFPAEVKSIDTAHGVVTSLVAVFGNVDAQNDRILHGAFTNTIMKWKNRMAAGTFLPVLHAHKDDPEFALGKVIDLEQTSEGLVVQEQYFLDQPKAARAFALVREGVLPGSSFAYDVKRAKVDGDGIRNLAELDLLEVGPTFYPANDQTRTVGVKAVDNTAWDKNKAMSACSTAAEYGKVCAAEHTTGTPDQRQHWALPHHYLDRWPAPNADGVAAARARVGQVQEISDAERAAAQKHLDGHAAQISGKAIEAEDKGAAAAVELTLAEPEVVSAFADAIDTAFRKAVDSGMKAGRVISAKNESQLRQARDLIDQVLSAVGDGQAAPAAGKAEEPEVKAAADDVELADRPLLADARALFAATG